MLRFPTALVAMALAGVLCPTTASASSLSVDGSAAFSGSYGLRATPGCGHPFSLEITSPPVPGLPDEAIACTTITAVGVDIVPPGAIFRAGDSVLLGNSFRVSRDAAFSTVLDASLYPYAWVEDRSPVSERTYQAQFLLNLDDLSLAQGDRLVHFVAFSADRVAQFRVVLVRNSLLQENRLIVEARQDSGAYLSTTALNEELLLEPDWNKVRIYWRAADTEQSNGQLRVEVTNLSSAGVYAVELSCIADPTRTCLANQAGSIDSVRWGAVDGLLMSSAGSLKLDRFVSWK